MKQPSPGTCLPTSLAVLLDKPVDEVITAMSWYIQPPRETKDGWTDIELVYTAQRYGVSLCPFIQDHNGQVYEEFNVLYETHDGILVGMLHDPPPGQIAGHAVAKKDGWLIDPTWGSKSDAYGSPYTRLYGRIFYAWVNNVRIPDPRKHGDVRKDRIEVCFSPQSSS